MKAWRVHTHGEPKDVMSRDDVPSPTLTEGGVRIEVHRTSLNFADVLLCRGEYQERPECPFTPGLEITGRVLEVDDAPASLQPGTWVIATPSLPAGGLADETVVQATDVFRMPDWMDPSVGAVLFFAYQTGFFGLHRRARLLPGETLLVHAGAGGVGSAAIQLGVAAGARVIATARGSEKVAVCRELGAELAIDSQETDFVSVVNEATDGRGADVIYDPVGGEVFERSTKCVAFEGRVVVVGFASGTIPQVRAGHVLVKNYSVVGLHWGLYRQRDPTAVRSAHEALLQMVRTGAISPLIHSELEFSQVSEGLQDLAEGRIRGKLVVRNR